MWKGVNKVALRLFEHNEKAYHAAVRMMEQYGKAAIVHPTGKWESYIASEMTLGEAVVRGILPAPKYVTTVYQYQKALAKYQARVDNLRAPGIQDVNQKYLDALRRALEQADGLDKVFAHHITNKSGKYIVFCANKEHMDEMVSHVPEWFAGVNPDVVVYEAYSNDPNTDKAFADFKTDTSDRLKLLFCIDMLNEGVHVEGISGVILFRPTISPIVYKQQIGRALTAGDNTTPLILDVVNNFEGLTSISGLQSEMQEAVHRLYANGEGDKIVTERFEVVEQVHDCRVLFEQLQASLSSSWDHYFSEASVYYAEHGNLNIPHFYVTAAGERLGQWVASQQWAYPKGKLTDEQVERLNRIGMYWGNRNDRQWNEGYQEARRYFDAHSDLNVPAGYVSPEGYNLGNWVKRQRFTRHNPEKSCAVLTEERIAKLDAIGIRWEKADSRTHRLELAQEPKRKSENLNVSANHKTGEDIGLCSRLFDPE